MGRVPNPRVLAEVLRSGNLHARLRAAREGLTGVRLQLIAAALVLPSAITVAPYGACSWTTATRAGPALIDHSPPSS
jgi:hypothetical protein